jgi:hypothetical protein
MHSFQFYKKALKLGVFREILTLVFSTLIALVFMIFYGKQPPPAA